MKRRAATISCADVLKHIKSVEREPHHRHKSHRAPLPYDFCKLRWQRVTMDPRDPGLHVEPHSEKRVDRYAARIQKGETPPAVVLVDRRFWYEIADGAHRIAAARAAGSGRIEAIVGRERKKKKKK
jgi:hypothetical protein